MSHRLNWEDAFSIIEPQITADGVHVWPFDPAFPIDVRFLRFSPKVGIRMNRHDYFELLYVHSGEAEYQVQDRLLPIRQGDLFVMGSTVMHRMAQYPRGAVRAAVLYFHPHLIRELEYLMPFLVQDSGFPHVVPAASKLPSQVFDLMRRTAAELPAHSPRARLSVTTYLKMILVLLVNYYSDHRGAEEAFSRRHRDLERLKPLFDYVDAHYSQPVNVHEAAAILHMSRSSFMRFFKQVTGEPFLEWLHQFRIEKAQLLLARTDKPLAEISAEVGFCDQSYFGAVFKRLVGATPREYRQSRSADLPGGPAADL